MTLGGVDGTCEWVGGVWMCRLEGVEDDLGEDMVVVSDGGMIWGLLR